MLRGAVIGLGNIAIRGHFPAYLGDEALRSVTQIVAVMDISEGNHAHVSKILPAARFYSDIHALLENEELDFVDICSPPTTHLEYIRVCSSRSIHVICEKPLTENLPTSTDVVNAVANSNIVFVPCHQYKYSPLWKCIFEKLQTHEIGRVTLAQFNVFRLQADTGTEAWNPSWRINKQQSGGGILVDTGAHYFYLAQYFFGMPVKVSAVLRNLKHQEYGVEDTAVCTLEYDKMLMQVNLTWAAAQRANSVSIAGTEGSLLYDGSKLLLSNANGTRDIPMPDVSDKRQYVQWYVSLFKEFVRRVEAKDYSHDLLNEAFQVTKLLDLCYRSSAEQTVLPCR